ncbi:hypothetical protein GWI33_010559 [Rhynchophorus ferrugineus]|uniref:Uncharacterized protein n=1 Tax=Rhynchophorus ferrugineus TaxID=354439 RepID=A0A834IXA6_RHYFE|nr:hypothetical protein GWI33_010559 [Rhynchophorus ferrugineus]
MKKNVETAQYADDTVYFSSARSLDWASESTFRSREMVEILDIAFHQKNMSSSWRRHPPASMRQPPRPSRPDSICAVVRPHPAASATKARILVLNNLLRKKSQETNDETHQMVEAATLEDLSRYRR